MCEREPRAAKKKAPPVPPVPPHPIEHPDDDEELQTVREWLQTRNQSLALLLRIAVQQAVGHILDGANTGRFYLQDDDVDSDEKAAVGTQLQYRVIRVLDLDKLPPLDTVIEGVAVDIKNTVGDDWMIPKEAQCELCLLMRIDARNDRFSASLMRTHEVLLNQGNQDKKRSIQRDAVRQYSVPLFDPPWVPLPRNPLRDLTREQRAVVFNPRVGQTRRIVALFSYLPQTVLQRDVLLTVCAGFKDPLRRVRQARPYVREEHGLEMLCGTWTDQRQAASALGYDLSGDAWVAVPSSLVGRTFD